jgi:hypothetical protein
LLPLAFEPPEPELNVVAGGVALPPPILPPPEPPIAPPLLPLFPPKQDRY